MSEHQRLTDAVNAAAGRKLSASSSAAHEAATRELAEAEHARDVYAAAHSDD